MTKKPPGPGVYPDVPFEEYLTWPYVSKSNLTTFVTSPAQYVWEKDHPRKASDNMLRGSAVDCLLFDGREVYNSRFAFYTGKRDMRIKAYQEFCEAHKERQILTPCIASEAEEIVAAIQENTLARRRLEASVSQLSVVWIDRFSGVTCKGRPDMVCPTLNEISDLKVTGDIGKFARTAADFKYHWQAAMYLDGLIAAQGASVFVTDHPGFSFLVVEDHPVYRVEVFKLSQRAIELGRAQYRAALLKFAECTALNNWPRDSEQVQILDLPAWAYPKSEEE